MGKVRTKALVTKLVDIPEYGIHLEYYEDHSGAIFFVEEVLRGNWVIKVHGLYGSTIHTNRRGMVGKLIGLHENIISKEQFIAVAIGFINVVTNFSEAEVEGIKDALKEVL